MSKLASVYTLVALSTSPWPTQPPILRGKRHAGCLLVPEIEGGYGQL